MEVGDGELPFGPQFRFENPYRREISSFDCTSTWFDHLTLWAVDGLPSSADDSSPLDADFELVATSDQLSSMIDDITTLGAKELAIDLEHHSYRSFQGFTCLMQISTRAKDYVIDTIALRLEMHRLLHIFANPNIVKVALDQSNRAL